MTPIHKTHTGALDADAQGDAANLQGSANPLDIAAPLAQTAALVPVAPVASVAHAPAAAPAGHEVVFVDTTLQNWQSLLKDVSPGATVVMLDPAQNGVTQMADALAGKSGITAVHVLSHGGEGYLVLGNTLLSSYNLADYQSSLATIQKAMAPGADMLLYGCDVAQGDIGTAFVNQLAKATGADVAASTNDTGAQGDWALEYHTGHVEATAMAAPQYEYDLATIKVTNLNDSGAGSLRAAVTAATGNAAADTIVFDPALFAGGAGTITLTTGALNVHGVGNADAFTFVGPGEGLLTISGNNSSRIFVADAFGGSANTSALSISGMTLTNGNSTSDTHPTAGGGAILSYVSGALTLDHVRITNSTASSYGGGLRFYGAAANFSMRNSTVSGNAATGSTAYGGGIAASGSTGTLYIGSSTVSGNTSDRGGGGLDIGGSGSAIVSIVNSTIADNSSNAVGNNGGAGGGLLVAGAIASITNTTITGNRSLQSNTLSQIDGGGVATVNGTLSLKNTLIAGNSSATNVATNQNLVVGQNVTVSGSNNLVTTVGVFSNGVDNMTGTVTTLGSALGTLAYNGGAVKTIAITTGSNAISAGIASGAPTVDARGFGRGGTTDIGAYEFSDNNSFSFSGVVSPANGVIDVPVGSDLVIDFGVPVSAVAAKNIVIYRQSDNAVLETIAANNTGKVTFSSGTGGANSKVTVNPTANLVGSTAYYVLIDSGAFQDGSSNTFNGISSTSAWAFTAAASLAAITSATYNASSGQLVVTGSGMTAGDTIVAANLTLTGQGGASYTLTSGNTTAGSATTFTVNLNANDRLAVNGLLNKDASTTAVDGTTFNLAGAAGWDSTAGSSADLTGNGITTSNVVPPTITSATYDASAGVLTVIGTRLVKAPGATNDITVSKLTLSGEGGASYTLTSDDVEITSATGFSITLNGADRAAVSVFMNNSGTTATGGASYNLAAVDDWNTVINNTDISDATSPVSVSNVPVPTIAPTGSTYDASTGVLVVAGTGLLSLAGAANDIDVSKLSMTGDGGTIVALSSSSSVDITSSTSFTVTLSAADRAAVNLLVNKNGGTSTDISTYTIKAAENWAAGANAGATVVDLNGNTLVASGVAVPAITSATYDAATGTLVVSGTGFTHLTGANNDIVVSKLSITGDATAYTLTSGNVEVTSGTSFTVALNATDIAALASRINKNGSSSTGSVTYNLAAAEDWAAGAAAALNVADLAGNGITASNVVPPAPSAPDLAAGSDSGTSSTDGITNIATPSFTGTAVAGATVTLYDTDGTTVLGSTTADGAGNWSVPSSTLADGVHTVTAKATVSAIVSSASTGLAITIDTTAPTTTIATTAFSADTGTSSTDFITKTAAQTLSGTVSANMVAGEFVEVSLNNGTSWVTATTTVGQNNWTLAGQTLTASNTLKVRVSDTAGNSGTVASQAYVLDSTAPTTTIATKVFSADTGTSSTDFITKTAAQTVSGTVSANMVAGQFVEVSLDNGSTWTTATTTVGQNTWSLAGQTLTASDTLKVRVTDTAGNTGTVASQVYVLDTTVPTATIATTVFSADTGTSSTDFITKTAAQTISGTVSANMVAGEIVEVSLDNGSTWATATTTVGQNTWSLAGQTLTGSDTLKVRVSDTAGNSGTVASQAYVLDTAAPTAAIATSAFSADTGTSSTDFITKTAAQTVSGTVSANMVAGEFVEVSLNNGSTWMTATTTVGQNTWSLSGQTLTANDTLKVRVSDVAGNTGTVASQAYVFDTTAPIATIATTSFSADTGSSSTDFVTKTAAQTLSGTVSANMVAGEFVEVSLNSGGTWTTATTMVGQNTWSLSGQTLTASDTLKVRVTDTAGNTGTVTSQAYVLDTTAPTATIATTAFSADTGVSSTDFITNTAAQTISGTVSANMVAGEFVEVSLNNGSTWTTATTTVGQNTWSLAGQTLTASDTLKVRVSDLAGNTGTVASQAYVLESAALTTTIVTTSFSADTGSSATDFITKTAAQTVSGTLSANVAAGQFVEVSLNNGGTWTTATTTVGQNTWSLAGQTLTGSDTLKVRVSDAAGNTGTVASQAYVFDTTAPTATIATTSLSADTGSSSTDFVTKTAAQTLSGTVSANMVAGEFVEVSLNNGSTWTTATTTVGQNTWSLSGQTLTASDTLKVRVTDTAGNTGTVASQAYVLDTTAPTATIATTVFSADTGTSSTDFVTKTAAQTLSGTVSANMVAGEFVEVSLNNGATWATATTTVGQNTWSLAGQTLTASDTLKVRVADTAGNTGTVTSQAYVLDITAPTATIATSAFSADTGVSSTDFITNTAAQTISGTVSANMVAGEFVEVSLNNGGTWTTATTTVGQNTWSLSGQTLTASDTLKVRVTDTAGNTGTVTSQAYVLDTTAPTATIATTAFSADTGVSSTDFITNTAAQTISGTVSANMVAGEFVEVSLNNGSTWTTATTTVGQNTWSLAGQTLTASDTLKVRVSDLAGNTGTVASQAYVLESAALTTTIVTTSFSADTGSSATDFITKTAAQTVSGTLSANVAAGQFVEVSLNNGGTWTTATTTVGQNTWSLAGQTLTGSDTLKVRVADTAGNTGTVASQAYVLDTIVPTATIATSAFSADTGTSSTDLITKTAAQTISGTVSANMVAGEFVEVSLNNGSTWTTATTTVGQNTWSLSGQTLTASDTLKVRVSDVAGNTGTVASQAYVLDTTAPIATIATTSFSADTGTSSTDFITKTAAQTISGTVSANMVAGELVEVSLNNGATWVTATTTVGQNTWSLSGQTLTASDTLKVRVADTAGNTGTVASQAYVLDTTAPTATIATKVFSADTGTSSTDFITKTATQTLSGTVSANMVAGEFVEVSLNNGGTWTTATTTVGQNTWSLSGQTLTASDTLKVRVTDTAGNTGTVTSQAYVLDTTAPTATIATTAFSADTGVSSTDFITNTAAQTISGTVSANMVAGEFVEVSLNNGSTWTTATTTVGQNTWSLAGQTLTASDTLKVRVSDLAGNTGTVASQAYVLESAALTTTIVTTSFSADTGSSATDFITKTAAQTVSGTLSANVAAGQFVEVSLNNGGTWTTATTTVGQNTWSLAGQTLTASDTLKVRVADTAGNTGTVASQAYVLDTTAPTATITTKVFSADTGSSATDFITKTAAQTVSGTVSANMVAGEWVEVSLDNGGTWTTASTTVGQSTWSLSGQTLTASDTLKVRVTDTAGNTGTVASQAYVLDITAPTATIATSAFSADTGISSTDFITKTAAQTISGTVSANMVAGEIVEVSLDNGSTWTAATTTVGQNTWSLAGQTLTASNTLKVRVADTAGNTGTVASQAYVLDTTAPTAPSTPDLTAGTDSGSSNTDDITKIATPTFTGTAEANTSVSLYDTGGATLLGTTTADGAGNWSITSSSLAEGVHTVTTKATDVAGNVSSASSGLAVTVDTTAPSATLATTAFSADTGTSSTDFITKTAAQTISGTVSANMVAGEFVEVSLNNGATWTTATTTVGQSAWSLAGQTLTASDTLKVRVSDVAGNTGTVTSQAYVLDTTAPTPTIATKVFSADTGTSSTDFITRTAAQTLSGTVSANMVAGEIVEVSLNNGGTWTTATTTVGQNTWSLAGQTLTASDTLKVRVSDVAGNTGTVASQAYVLDTTAPTATIATSAFSADTGVSNSDFITGTTAQTVSGTVSANMVAGELVEVSLNNGTTWTTATTTVGQTTWSLAGQTLTASDTLKVRVADLAGNTGTIASQAYVLDTTAPAFTSGTVNANTLVLTYTDAALLDATNVAPNSAFTVLADGSPIAVNAVAVNAAAKTVTLTLSSAVANGQVVTIAYTDPTGGNDANATQDAAGNDAATLAATAVTNTTVAPVVPVAPVVEAGPVIASASYDASTGTLLVSGSGFLPLGGAANDIDVSKLAIAGEGGISRSLTSANVEITSSASFAVALNSADKAVVDQIINKLGSSATGGAVYNLAAAEHWAAGAAANLLVADLTGNSITASNVATPAITSATYDATTGVLTVTGTGFSQLAGAANDIDTSKLSIQGDATPYTLTSASVDISSGTRFSITLNAADQAALTSRINVSGLVSQGGITYNLAAAEDWAKGAATAIVVADLSGNGINATLTCPFDPFRIDADKDGVPDAVELASGTNPAVKDNNVFANTSLFVNQLYRDLFGREGAGDAGAQYWTGQLNNGALSKSQLLQSFLDSSEFDSHAGAIMRLYHAALGRSPELCGYNYWLGMLNAGTSPAQLGNAFANSAEFRGTNSNVSDAAFMDLIYQNVLKRTPDAAGKAYWVDQLQSGAQDRGTVLYNVAQSSEFKAAMKGDVAVDVLYLGLLDRGVTVADAAYWTSQYGNYASTAQFLQATTAASAEYHDRILPATAPDVTLVGVLQDLPALV